MATVRIYKIAELLNMSSQDVVTLLRKESGIEVKSASSTIEEVVAASFVERQARERKITLPGKSQWFADAPAAKAGAKKGGKAAKAAAPEPAAPAPTLRPRLIKTAKPAPVPEEAAPEAADTAPASDAPEDIVEPAAAAETPAEPAAQEAAPAGPATEEAPEAETAEPAAAAAAPAEALEDAEAEAPAPPAAAPSRASRVVPPSIRLRIEDPATGQAPAARPTVPRTPIRPPSQPPAPITRQPVPGQRPAPRPPIGARPPLGGPRPLPSQPVRPASPGARPGMPGARPPYPGQFRPGGYRPPFHQRSSGGSKRRDDRGSSTVVAPPPPPITRSVTLAEGMTVKDLAEKLDVKVKDVMLKLMQKRMMMTINTTLDTDTAQMIAREFGADVEMRTFEEELTEEATEASLPENVVTRAPVVTVMGHVDHGKTTLLDSIRSAKVAEREAGGITQHIGAYAVNVAAPDGGADRKVVFLDTPGHEAFTMMRARGARVTDVVILVVAADDGVMPQTKEAIDHAKAAGVPMIVAINKVDKPGANAERVKRELTDLGHMPEEWGGQTVMVEVSAKLKKNLDQLLEMVLLVTDIGELKADPSRYATGTVLEAKVDRGRGPVATVLVQNGTLRVGDDFLAGTVVGRVRALIDDRGRQVKEAPPSTPVEVLGLTSLPSPGDTLQAVEDAVKARQVAQYRQAQAKDKALGAKGGRLTLESLQAQMAEGGMKELPVIIKADVQGSAEVLAQSLAKLSDERVKVKIIHTGVGAINESDVLLASASNAIVVGFNVKPDRNAADVAEREEVDIRFHTVIYNVTDEMKKAMTGLLEPTLKEARLGTAEVRQVFKAPKIGTIAGCMVTDGKIMRSGDAQARLMRDGALVWTGKIASLKRFKDDVSEVTKGFECGIGLANFNDIKAGDVIEAFSVERIAGTL